MGFISSTKLIGKDPKTLNYTKMSIQIFTNNVTSTRAQISKAKLTRLSIYVAQRFRFANKLYWDVKIHQV